MFLEQINTLLLTVIQMPKIESEFLRLLNLLRNSDLKTLLIRFLVYIANILYYGQIRKNVMTLLMMENMLKKH
jgi:hypothetical protein